MTAAPQPSAADIRSHLARVLESQEFVRAKLRARLLEYLVEKALTGDSASLKEYAIGVDVFERPATFDPRIEPVVRVRMVQLRAKLNDYYATAGQQGPVRIRLDAGTYVPRFETVELAAPLSPADACEEPAALHPPRRRPRWPWAAAAGALVVGGLALATLNPFHREIRSAVVLPFENLTGDSTSSYLADGITEQLTDALAQAPSLRVVARTSAFQFKNKGVDVREVGRQLGVDAVVEGSLRKFDRGYRLTVQVNRSSDGYHILSKTFDGGTQDLARMENDMAAPVLAVLRPGVVAARRHIPDPAAYDLYLKSSYVPGRVTPETYDRAIALLSQAIERDPMYAEAYAALAETYVSKAISAVLHPSEFVAPATAAAQKALELDPLSGPALAAGGMIEAAILHDWKRGEEELRHAIRLAPGRPRSHNWLGSVLVQQGRFADGLAELRTADALDPLNPAPTVARALYMARQYDQSIEECGRMLRLHPDLHLAHLMIGLAWECKGALDKALPEYQQFFAKVPGQPFLPTATYAHYYAHMGQREKARQLIYQMEHIKLGEGAPSAYDISMAYAALGDRDKGCEWLARAFDNGNVWWLKVEPLFDPLRGDPRFQELLRKAGLN